MKKNLVVVGYGGMGGWHVEHALKSDVVNLLGIYDIDPAKIEKAKSKNIFAYDSLEAVLADERVDLIPVASLTIVTVPLSRLVLTLKNTLFAKNPRVFILSK